MKQKFLSLTSILLLALIIFVLLAFAVRAGAQTNENLSSGGTFMLEKQVVAGGGNQMQPQQPQQPPINQSGTAGQPVAGYKSIGGSFTLYSGFWTPDDFSPTAANVVVGGRIKTADETGIRNVRVTILFPSGETRATLSASFGYYRFTGIPAGETYIITVAAKRYTFSQPSQVRQILDETQDIDFIAGSP